MLFNETCVSICMYNDYLKKILFKDGNSILV
jgi:hypothetical protein